MKTSARMAAGVRVFGATAALLACAIAPATAQCNVGANVIANCGFDADVTSGGWLNPFGTCAHDGTNGSSSPGSATCASTVGGINNLFSIRQCSASANAAGNYGYGADFRLVSGTNVTCTIQVSSTNMDDCTGSATGLDTVTGFAPGAGSFATSPAATMSAGAGTTSLFIIVSCANPVADGPFTVLVDDVFAGIGLPPPDTTPNSFSFVDQTNVALGATVTSAGVTVLGINAASAIQVSGPGGLYSINGGGFVSAPGVVNAGDVVRAQHTASGAFSTSVDTTVTIGGVSDTFTSTTLPPPDTSPDAFAFVDQAGVPLSTVVTSNSVTVTGIAAASPIQVAGPGALYSVNGGGFVAAASTVNAGDTVRVRHTSAATPGTTVDSTLTIGGVSDVFSSTTQSSVVAVPALGGLGLVALAVSLAFVALLAFRRPR